MHCLLRLEGIKSCTKQSMVRTVRLPGTVSFLGAFRGAFWKASKMHCLLLPGRKARYVSGLFVFLCALPKTTFYLAPRIMDGKLSAFWKVPKAHCLLRFGRLDNALSPPSRPQSKVHLVRSNCPASQKHCLLVPSRRARHVSDAQTVRR